MTHIAKLHGVNVSHVINALLRFLIIKVDPVLHTKKLRAISFRCEHSLES